MVAINRSDLLKALVVIAVILALVFIDSGSGPRRSSEQQDYDSWLAKVEGAVNSGLDDPRVVPDLQITAKSISDDTQIDWQLTVPPFGDPNLLTSVERIIRLLGLLREANILGASDGANCKQKCIQITAGDPQHNFATVVSDRQVSKNAPLALMLKLFGTFAAADKREQNKVTPLD